MRTPIHITLILFSLAFFSACTNELEQTSAKKLLLTSKAVEEPQPKALPAGVDTVFSNHLITYRVELGDTIGELIDPHQGLSTTEIETKYKITRKSITRKRLAMAESYGRAGTDSARRSVLALSRPYLIEALTDELFPYWYGTNWDFNGYTAKPRNGEVACGYFVSTTLQHAGLKVNRYELAKCYSHAIVTHLCDSNQVQVIRPKDRYELLEKMQAWNNDLYVVGLDNHVGFLLKDEAGIWFIHSNYGSPFGVTRELARYSGVFSSNTYVIGNLTGGSTFVSHWLKEKELVVNR